MYPQIKVFNPLTNKVKVVTNSPDSLRDYAMQGYEPMKEIEGEEMVIVGQSNVIEDVTDKPKRGRKKKD